MFDYVRGLEEIIAHVSDDSITTRMVRVLREALAQGRSFSEEKLLGMCECVVYEAVWDLQHQDPNFKPTHTALVEAALLLRNSL